MCVKVGVLEIRLRSSFRGQFLLFTPVPFPLFKARGFHTSSHLTRQETMESSASLLYSIKEKKLMKWGKGQLPLNILHRGLSQSFKHNSKLLSTASFSPLATRRLRARVFWLGTYAIDFIWGSITCKEWMNIVDGH